MEVLQNLSIKNSSCSVIHPVYFSSVLFTNCWDQLVKNSVLLHGVWSFFFFFPLSFLLSERWDNWYLPFFQKTRSTCETQEWLWIIAFEIIWQMSLCEQLTAQIALVWHIQQIVCFCSLVSLTLPSKTSINAPLLLTLSTILTQKSAFVQKQLSVALF